MKGESVLQKQIIIDPDEIRKLLAPWGYDKTNAPEFVRTKQSSSRFDAKQRISQLVQNRSRCWQIS